MTTKSLLKKFLPYYKKYWKTMVLDLFFATLTIFCELVFPLIVKDLTDKAISGIATITANYIVIVGLIYMVLRIIDTGANYYMQYIGHVMGSKMEKDMRRDMFQKFQEFSHTYYNETKVGQLMSRITSDLFDITEFAHHCPEEFYIATLKIVMSFVILSSFNFYLTLIIFALIPVMLVLVKYFTTKMKKQFRAQRVQIGEINSQVEDSLLGIRVVKSFANENVEIDKFEEGNEKFLNIKKKMYKAMAGFHSVTRVFDGLMYITVVVAGAFFLMNGKITVGEFTAYLLFISTLLQSVRRIVEFAEQFGRGMTGIERFAEIMDTEADIKDDETSKELNVTKGEIQFKDVTFSYDSIENKIFKDLNFTIEAGKSLAIVGSSGSGKTTLSNLIPRFFNLKGGEITIDGMNVANVKLRSLREKIGIVQQDVYMFSGTIRENIEYGKPGSSFDDVVSAARLSGADEFIEKLPKGYDTFVGERGVKLSGGQKQRLSIARVFLKNPPILILDEATSALDNESERLVQKSLETLSKNRTTIIIAHRLTTVRNADDIIVLTKEGISERGTHDQLYEKRGEYYKMLNA